MRRALLHHAAHTGTQATSRIQATLFHSDARQKTWHEANHRIVNMQGLDRPITPVKALGHHARFQTVRRAIGRAETSAEVMHLLHDTATPSGDMPSANAPTVSAAVKRMGELRCRQGLSRLLDSLREGGLAVAPVDPVLASSVLTALTKCVCGADAAATAACIAEGRVWWDAIAVRTAPAYGAALALCARTRSTEGAAWADELYSTVRGEANVIHLCCYLRVLASQGRWDDAAVLWTDPTGPFPNAACLAGLLVEADTLERLDSLWKGHYPEVNSLTVPAPTLYTRAMQRYLSFGHPCGVLEVEAERVAADAPDYVLDRFGNKRILISLWHYRATAHLMLRDAILQGVYPAGDAWWRERGLSEAGGASPASARGAAVRHEGIALACAKEALLPHVAEGVPEKHLAYFRTVVGSAGGEEGLAAAKGGEGVVP